MSEEDSRVVGGTCDLLECESILVCTLPMLSWETHCGDQALKKCFAKK